MKLLLIEDETRMVQALKELLEGEHYEVDACTDGISGEEALLSGIYDVVVSDVMLPGKDGFAIASEAKKHGIKTPILMLTAKSGIDDKVYGLDCGADDGEALRFGDITLDAADYEVCCEKSKEQVRLGEKEYRLLEYLMLNRGVVLSKEQIAVRIWGYENEAEYNKVISIFLILSMAASVASCGKIENGAGAENTVNESTQSDTEASENETTANGTESSETSEREAIEEALNLANNEEQEWTYSAGADTWTLSVVSAVCNPEIPEEQGVSVAVPGAYVKGIDTDGDGNADVTASDGETAVCGSLVIDYEAQITDENGQTYTAANCPVILTTGAAGYSEQQNSLASTAYAQYGYVSVSCGNLGQFRLL